MVAMFSASSPGPYQLPAPMPMQPRAIGNTQGPPCPSCILFVVAIPKSPVSESKILPPISPEFAGATEPYCPRRWRASGFRVLMHRPTGTDFSRSVLQSLVGIDQVLPPGRLLAVDGNLFQPQ